jgi:hypothetical protein
MLRVFGFFVKSNKQKFFSPFSWRAKSIIAIEKNSCRAQGNDLNRSKNMTLVSRCHLPDPGIFFLPLFRECRIV